MSTPKTDYLRKRWVEYIEEINRMRWNIKPNTPEHKRFVKAFTTLLNIAHHIKSTSEIEEGDTVTNGEETFVVIRVEDDRVYSSDNTFNHANTLRIKQKFI